MLSFISSELWEQTRLITYCLVNTQQTVWEFMPLKHDPSPEERARLIEEAKEKSRIAQDERARSILQAYKLSKLNK